MASSNAEPSSPLISERSESQEETPSSGQLNKYFPPFDDELQEVAYLYNDPLNADNLEDFSENNNELTGNENQNSDSKSTCLTPVSFNLDLSMMAHKGSLTLSVEVIFHFLFNIYSLLENLYKRYISLILGNREQQRR